MAVVDQAVKQIMLAVLTEGEPHHVIGDWFRFNLLFNPGAAFSIGGEGSTWLFTTIQLAFVLGVAIAAPRIDNTGQALGLALIASGTSWTTSRLARSQSLISQMPLLLAVS